jgi:chromosome segregation ATPase
MKTQALTLLACAVLGLETVSCSGNRAQKQKKDLVETRGVFEKERDELHRKLQKLEVKIDMKIQELETKKEKADAEMKTEIDALKAELKQEKTEVGKAIDDMEKATVDTWADIKGSVNKTTQEIEEGWKKFTLNVEIASEKDKS